MHYSILVTNEERDEEQECINPTIYKPRNRIYSFLLDPKRRQYAYTYLLTFLVFLGIFIRTDLVEHFEINKLTKSQLPIRKQNCKCLAFSYLRTPVYVHVTTDLCPIIPNYEQPTNILMLRICQFFESSYELQAVRTPVSYWYKHTYTTEYLLTHNTFSINKCCCLYVCLYIVLHHDNICFFFFSSRQLHIQVFNKFLLLLCGRNSINIRIYLFRQIAHHAFLCVHYIWTSIRNSLLSNRVLKQTPSRVRSIFSLPACIVRTTLQFPELKKFVNSSWTTVRNSRFVWTCIYF